MRQAYDPVISWKRNLAVMWLAQVFTVMGFSFSFPFMPLFVQELGISGGGQASLWAGIVQMAMGASLVLTGPIWGLASDRYGRKLNVLRATFAGALVLSLSALSTNVYHLMLFRFLTGLSSGTFGPAMALVAATTPKERLPFSMGVLQSAFFTGNTLGPLFGGLAADAWGFEGAFIGTGVMLAIAGVIVLLFAKEDFHRSPQSVSIFQRRAYANLLHTLTSRELLPVLGTVFVAQFSPIMSFAVLPVVLDGLSASGGGSVTGVAFAVMGATGGAASYAAGWLSRRVSLRRILLVACVGGSLSFAPLFVVDSVSQFYLFLAFGGAFQGAMVTMGGALVGMAVSAEQQGVAFGGMQSVNVSAFSLGPLTGGVIAAVVGLRWVFLAQSAGLLAAAVLVMLLLSARLSAGRESADDVRSESHRDGG